jgi:hypothetical protein
MERLNEIAEGQMQSILDLAIAAADAANSINPSNDDGAKFVEKVTAVVDEMKEKIEGPTVPSHDAGAGDPAAATADPFCRAVENDIAMALVNSVTFQQQLNTIGAAVLTQGAQLVLTAGGESSGG